MADVAVGIALALPGVIDLCIKYGQFLHDKLLLFKDVSDVIDRESFLIGTARDGIEEILAYFKQRLQSLDDTFAKTLQQWCRHLSLYLQDALDALGGSDLTASKLKLLGVGMRFALVNADKLKRARKDLEEWYIRFSRRALTYKTFKLDALVENTTKNALETKFSSLSIASEIAPTRSAATLRLAPPDPEGVYEPVERCGLEIYRPTYTTERVALEHRYHRGFNSNQVEKLGLLVAEIASKLCEVDTERTGLLKCKGFSHDVTRERYSIHFLLPSGLGMPKSLRALLADPNNKTRGIKHSLSSRVKLSMAIASAVLYIHMSGFVHKNIRPENILVFEKNENESAGATTLAREKWPYAIGPPFLVGYDGVRKADAGSQALACRDWKQRIYLAPGRLKMKDNEEFHMRHDVYSLGVVLFEIALWRDFTDDGEARQSISSELKSTQDPKKLLLLQSVQVSRCVGDKHASAVRACINEMEAEKSEHQLNDQDGLVQGRAYISQVISQLEEISI